MDFKRFVVKKKTKQNYDFKLPPADFQHHVSWTLAAQQSGCQNQPFNQMLQGKLHFGLLYC